MTDNWSYSLLSEPLISVRHRSGPTDKVSLPQVLSGLTTGDIVAFEALQKHQRQPWHSFLTQLGAIAMDRAGEETIPRDPDTWRQWLLKLTGGQTAPWSMVVSDVSEPAFMQPPVPEGSLDDANYKPDIPTPDELDMLITSRNHDLKMHRMIHPDLEHWMYALITLQTMEGFLGRGNYGIVRMNGGFGNRPMVAMTPELDWSTRFQRDLSILVHARDQLSQAHDYSPNGRALLWLPPWDGGKQSGIPLRECDPLFIEVCRRIRFTENDDGFRCYRANTKGTRIEASDDLSGITGDPWTPIDKSDGKALTVGENGFSYELLKDITLGKDYEQSAALTPDGFDENGGYLLATSLVRGQGKTKGFHHRVVPIPPRVARILRRGHRKQNLAERAQQRVEMAATVQSNVLYPALRSLLSGGTNEQVDSEQVAPWTNAFDAAVDDAFFPELWGSVDQTPEEAERDWKRNLFNWAEEQLKDAIQSAPFPSIRRYRAISSAESIFYGSAREHLEEIFDDSDSPAKEEEHEPIAS